MSVVRVSKTDMKPGFFPRDLKVSCRRLQYNEQKLKWETLADTQSQAGRQIIEGIGIQSWDTHSIAQGLIYG